MTGAGLGKIGQIRYHLFRDFLHIRGDKFMDPTIGLFLVIGFPTLLCVGIWAFGKFSQEPK